MRRVLVIGPSGAGKSTLARRIGDRTGLPVVHLDRLYWRPGWVPAPDPEWDRVVEALIAEDTWILEGNYSRTLPTRIAASDTVVMLDVPRWLCLARVVRRRWEFRGAARPDRAAGCPEQLSWELVKRIWTYPSRRREVADALDTVPRRPRLVVLRGQPEIERFVAELG